MRNQALIAYTSAISWKLEQQARTDDDDDKQCRYTDTQNIRYEAYSYTWWAEASAKRATRRDVDYWNNQLIPYYPF